MGRDEYLSRKSRGLKRIGFLDTSLGDDVGEPITSCRDWLKIPRRKKDWYPADYWEEEEEFWDDHYEREKGKLDGTE